MQLGSPPLKCSNSVRSSLTATLYYYYPFDKVATEVHEIHSILQHIPTQTCIPAEPRIVQRAGLRSWGHADLKTRPIMKRFDYFAGFDSMVTLESSITIS